MSYLASTIRAGVKSFRHHMDVIKRSHYGSEGLQVHQHFKQIPAPASPSQLRTFTVFSYYLCKD